jgi:hypothetical protein
LLVVLYEYLYAFLPTVCKRFEFHQHHEIFALSFRPLK